MGSIKQNRQGFRIVVLALAIVACAWLIPGTAIAGGAASRFKVTVAVEESIGVLVGERVVRMVKDDGVMGMVVTRAASSRLEKTDGGSVPAAMNDEDKLPARYGEDRLDSAVAGGGPEIFGDVILTVSRL